MSWTYDPPRSPYSLPSGTMQPENGKWYMIRGGILLRWPQRGVSAPEVRWEVTKDRARFLRMRWQELAWRGMWTQADRILEIMAEVGVGPSRIPERFLPPRVA